MEMSRFMYFLLLLEGILALGVDDKRELWTPLHQQWRQCIESSSTNWWTEKYRNINGQWCSSTDTTRECQTGEDFLCSDDPSLTSEGAEFLLWNIYFSVCGDYHEFGYPSDEEEISLRNISNSNIWIYKAFTFHEEINSISINICMVVFDF